MIYLIQNDREYDYDVRAIALAFYERTKIVEVTKEEFEEQEWEKDDLLLTLVYTKKRIQGWLKGKVGIEGTEEIKKMMEELRKRDLKVLLDKKINVVRDYKLKKEKNYLNNSESELFLSESDVIQYILEDETYITVRPSGTEPKIKYYTYTKGKCKKEADEKLENILNDFKEYMESLLK